MVSSFLIGSHRMDAGHSVVGSRSHSDGSCIHWLQNHKKEIVITLVVLSALAALVVGLLAVISNTTSFSAGGIGEMGLVGGGVTGGIGLLILLALASYYLYKKWCCSRSGSDEGISSQGQTFHGGGGGGGAALTGAGQGNAAGYKNVNPSHPQPPVYPIYYSPHSSIPTQLQGASSMETPKFVQPTPSYLDSPPPVKSGGAPSTPKGNVGRSDSTSSFTFLSGRSSTISTSSTPKTVPQILSDSDDDDFGPTTQRGRNITPADSEEDVGTERGSDDEPSGSENDDYDLEDPDDLLLAMPSRSSTRKTIPLSLNSTDEENSDDESLGGENDASPSLKVPNLEDESDYWRLMQAMSSQTDIKRPGSSKASFTSHPYQASTVPFSQTHTTNTFTTPHPGPKLNKYEIEGRVVQDYKVLEKGSSYDSFLHNLYGESECREYHLPFINEDEEYLDTFEDRLRLLYMPVRDFLGLTLPHIEKLADLEPELMYRRILCIHTQYTIITPIDSNTMKSRPILLEFFTTKGEVVFKTYTDYPILIGMLSHLQISDILKNPRLSTNQIRSLFPTHTESARRYTQHKLSNIDKKLLRPFLSKFTGTQLSLLPISYFQDGSIDWDRLQRNHDKVIGLLGIGKNRRDTVKIKEIVSTFTVDQIQDIAHLCTVKELSLFTPDQLKHERFPWSQFLKKGFGSAMHSLDADVFSSPHIPWDKIAAWPEEVCDLFDLPISISNEKDKTTAILNQMAMEGAIEHVAPYLTAEHLTCFDVYRLMDQQFPWAPFCLMGGFGSQMRYHGNQALASPYIRWDFVDKSEIATLFSIRGGDDKIKTKDLFKQLPSMEALREIAPKLTAEHLECFDKNAFNDKDFPWVAFNQLASSGFYMRLYVEPAIFALPHFPWAELAQSPEKTKELFTPTHNGDDKKIKEILRGISIPNIQLLIDNGILNEKDHKDLLTSEKQANVTFPQQA